ncbi:sulfurtransferase complex subunit TusB [Flocculibacter collagenilyticus]|uniref:sulfurtransferase complex subunit TusB n=1 Tax=Flocculibacter collagenilyticus TaxID=2744479 RepID=UPI0018F3D045|nr:sulfurtransferase complex subunit TusB [Flocculibacter collagenilyticus]
MNKLILINHVLNDVSVLAPIIAKGDAVLFLQDGVYNIEGQQLQHLVKQVSFSKAYALEADLTARHVTTENEFNSDCKPLKVQSINYNEFVDLTLAYQTVITL